LESLLELVAVKILSDEHELRRSSDTILPWLVGHTLEQGMYALEHVAVVAPLDGEHALHAVKILPVVVQEHPEPVVDDVEVDLSVHGEADARHGVVVDVVAMTVTVFAAHLALRLRLRRGAVGVGV
jgi:hypothetical protein